MDIAVATIACAVMTATYLAGLRSMRRAIATGHRGCYAPTQNPQTPPPWGPDGPAGGAR